MTDRTVDNAMFSLFVTDAEKQLKTLSSSLVDAQWAEVDNNTFNVLQQTLQSLSSGATISSLPEIASLFDAGKKYIKQMHDSKDSKQISKDEQLNELCDISSSLITISAENYNQWIHNNSSQLSNLTNTLASRGYIPEQESTESTPTKTSSQSILQDDTMLELFKTEVESQSRVIDEHLLLLESDTNNPDLITTLMRASHSIKGAARMIGLDTLVELTHKMEDCFVNTQKGDIQLNKKSIDLLLLSNDVLKKIPSMANHAISSWLASNPAIADLDDALDKMKDGKHFNMQNKQKSTPSLPDKSADTHSGQTDSNIRIESASLGRIMGLSNEILVQHNRLENHTSALQLIKKRHTELASSMAQLKHVLDETEIDDDAYALLLKAQERLENCRTSLIEEIHSLDDFERKSYMLSTRLNQEATSCKMKKFSEGLVGLRRMTRDISHQLNKQTQLLIEGQDTLVDSDILSKIETPINHLIRNAIDHGIEMPEQRAAYDKNQQGTISLSAHHQGGKLAISISDDGQGIDLEQLRKKIVNKGMTSDDIAARLDNNELLDFLFLPGFSTRENVTEYSGRGVGLDVVHSVVTELRGDLKCTLNSHGGLTFTLLLPVTLSVINSLVTSIGNELYAFPMSRIHAIYKTNASNIIDIENRQFIRYLDEDVSLVNASQIFNRPSDPREELEIIMLESRNNKYGLVVDKIRSETELSIHSLDSRLGKIKDISAASICENGEPVLIIDVDDILLSIEDLLTNTNIDSIRTDNNEQTEQILKILVIDDSLTVREVEKNLLLSKGYYVDTAVDGVDGWNTLKHGHYDLIITDIDMPRMNGIELVSKIKQDRNYNSTPVMIVSYKDNPEDRQKGMEAGADYYLTKGSFHDESLVEGVIDLIGEPC